MSIAIITITNTYMPLSSNAFENAVKFVDTPKSHGPKPNNLRTKVIIKLVFYCSTNGNILRIC